MAVKKKALEIMLQGLFEMVGAEGFEPTTR